MSTVGTTKLEQYTNVGHELYNHVLFYLMGRDPTHNNKDLNRHEEGTLNDVYKYNPILLRNDKNKFEKSNEVLKSYIANMDNSFFV